MPTQNGRSWSAWKILLVAVLGCAFAFGILLAATVYWVTSARDLSQSTTEKRLGADVTRIAPPAAQRRPDKASRPGPPPVVESRTNTGQSDGKFTNRLTIAEIKPSSSTPAPAKFVKNAILGSRSVSTGSLPGDDLFKE